LIFFPKEKEGTYQNDNIFATTPSLHVPALLINEMYPFLGNVIKQS